MLILLIYKTSVSPVTYHSCSHFLSSYNPFLFPVLVSYPRSPSPFPFPIPAHRLPPPLFSRFSRSSTEAPPSPPTCLARVPSALLLQPGRPTPSPLRGALRIFWVGRRVPYWGVRRGSRRTPPVGRHGRWEQPPVGPWKLRGGGGSVLESGQGTPHPTRGR